jgi:hypothetical protein
MDGSCTGNGQQLKLTPLSEVLEKLRVTQLIKKLPSFYGTRRSITVFTKGHHWSLPEPDETISHFLTLFPYDPF